MRHPCRMFYLAVNFYVFVCSDWIGRQGHGHSVFAVDVSTLPPKPLGLSDISQPGGKPMTRLHKLILILCSRNTVET